MQTPLRQTSSDGIDQLVAETLRLAASIQSGSSEAARRVKAGAAAVQQTSADMVALGQSLLGAPVQLNSHSKPAAVARRTDRDTSIDVIPS